MKNQDEQQNDFQHYQFNSEKQMQDAYKQIQNQVRDKFKLLTTDTLQEIRNNMKRYQNKITKQENKNLISQEREKIINQMKQHLSKCVYYQCKQVKQVVILYGFSKNKKLEDQISLICNQDIPGIAYKNSQCFYATKLNQKMYETHKLLKGI